MIIEDNLEIIHDNMDEAGIFLIDDDNQTVQLAKEVCFESGIVVGEDGCIRLILAGKAGNQTIIFQYFQGLSQETAALLMAGMHQGVEESNAFSFNECGDPV